MSSRRPGRPQKRPNDGTSNAGVAVQTAGDWLPADRSCWRRAMSEVTMSITIHTAVLHLLAVNGKNSSPVSWRQSCSCSKTAHITRVRHHVQQAFSSKVKAGKKHEIKRGFSSSSRPVTLTRPRVWHINSGYEKLAHVVESQLTWLVKVKLCMLGWETSTRNAMIWSEQAE